VGGDDHAHHPDQHVQEHVAMNAKSPPMAVTSQPTSPPGARSATLARVRRRRARQPVRRSGRAGGSGAAIVVSLMRVTRTRSPARIGIGSRRF
jgi:hypothetical protein